MYKSQIGQDAFVIKATKGKRNGTFIDIGAGHPILINNTYLLESSYNWKGVSIDFGSGQAYKCPMDDTSYRRFWSNNRKTDLVIADALTVDYNVVFEKLGSPNVIDYLDIDIEPPENNLAALQRVIATGQKFNMITFEHDAYRNTSIREPARELLESIGYIYIESDKPDQEDWFVVPELFENLKTR